MSCVRFGQLQLLQGYKIPTFRKYKQEMERSVSRSNQRNMLMMSVRDCGDPSYAEVFSSEDGPICMMHRKSQTCEYSLIGDMVFLG
ncbi:hypothetical protein Q8A67_004346 [Cirrhinus molitorella]|uniref:Uncharacterized protein n=1 Tax=Cirrhinus molitorella TaxID=172907 RepID=A0AA88U357_9TELE|nr:hypothetical protein Q8A67_004346 [Cirrhinus molitorella]